ncbi:MAG: S-layer homology domain-containing protein [Oscillospiraceae bacterium]|jgi:hypothetical protein|nr:S-layer homology domain-containing protein [Oscillospiraceae bacterium]
MKLKKTLALVLALVLAFGTLSVASAAVDFTDADEITYLEAVDVVSGIGAINGLGDGTFNPTGSITRAQAAKMIAYTVYGADFVEGLPLKTSSFSDVTSPDYDWAIPSIEYLVTNGIVDGVGDGKFAPASNVTGYQYIKMLLAALGYGALDEYIGSGWELNVHIDGLDAFAGDPLWSGLVKAFAGSAFITREEAALFCFNTLNSAMVRYIAIIGPGGYISSDSTLGELQYDLFYDRDWNDWGLYGGTWQAGDPLADISDFYVDDVLVGVIPAGTKYSEVADILGIDPETNKLGMVSFDNGVLDVGYGRETSDALKAMSELDTQVPTTTYVYLSAYDKLGGYDEYGTLVFHSVYEYLAVVDADTEDGETSFTVYDGEPTTVTLDSGSYEEGDYYVVVTKGTAATGTGLDPVDGEEAFLSIEEPDVLVGKATNWGTDSKGTYATIGGEKYYQSLSSFEASIGDYTDGKEYTFMFDSDGCILGAKLVDDTEDPVYYYGYVTGYAKAELVEGDKLTGEADEPAYERVSLYDETGTIQYLDLDFEVEDDVYTWVGAEALVSPIVNEVLIKYTLTADGKIDEIVDYEAIQSQNSAPVAEGDKDIEGVYLSDDTVVFYHSTYDGDAVKVINGYKALEDYTYTHFAILDDDETGIATAVVLKGTAEIEDAPTVAGFVYIPENYTFSKDTTTGYVTYGGVYVNGELGSLTFESDPSETGFWSLNTTADGLAELDVDLTDAVTDGTVKQVASTFIRDENGDIYDVDSSTAYYYVDSETGVMTALAGKPAADDEILAVAEGTSAYAIIIYTDPVTA